MKNDKIFDNAYKQLCRECYKKFNNPECYIGLNTSHLETYSKKKKKIIKFGGVGNVEKMLHFIM